MAEELLPINNISYHFVKTIHECVSEKVLNTSITCNNFDELLSDLKAKKEYIHKNKYSDIYITCSSLNKDLTSSTYLWHIDYRNNIKIYMLKLFDIHMSSNPKSVNSLPVDKTKQKPVNSLPVEKPKDSIPKNPESSNPNIPKDPEVSVPPSFLKKESKPKTNTSDQKEFKPMDLSDILRLLSQKLPMEQPIDQPIKQDNHPDATCFDSNPNDDIIITNNKKKEPEKKPEPKHVDQSKDEHPEVKCFKVRFTPDDKPEIVKVPFDTNTSNKSEQIPEKKPKQDTEKKTETETDMLYNFLKFLSEVNGKSEKKPVKKPEQKPEFHPEPFTKPIPSSLRAASNMNRKSESKKPTSTRFESKQMPNPFYRNENKDEHPMLGFPINRMDQPKYEDPFMRMFYNLDQDNSNHNKKHPEAKKRARDPFMEMFPFLI